MKKDTTLTLKVAKTTNKFRMINGKIGGRGKKISKRQRNREHKDGEETEVDGEGRWDYKKNKKERERCMKHSQTSVVSYL